MHTGHEPQLAAVRAGAGGPVSSPTAHAERVRSLFVRDRRSDLWTGLARLGGVLPPAGNADTDPWALLRGWKHPPGGGCADGRLVRATGSADSDARPRFDAAIPSGGYGWWYIDATSDADGPDGGQYGLTIIAFLGSVFSPYYRRSGRGDPIDHAALNVALYGPKARWTMTERSRSSVDRDADTITIGPSAMRWTGDALEIEIEERDKRLGVPWQRRVSGRIRLYPEALNGTAFALDPAGRHRWHCLAPRARIEVEMDNPSVRWKGGAYLDSNFGAESLEEGFRIWHWSRAHTRNGAVVCYEGVRRDGSHFASALRFGADGAPEHAELPPAAPLSNTLWQMERRTRADLGLAHVVKTWEDAPFYARSTAASRLYGERVTVVQESLDLDRFASPIVQFMLPYRMPRRL